MVASGEWRVASGEGKTAGFSAADVFFSPLATRPRTGVMEILDQSRETDRTRSGSTCMPPRSGTATTTAAGCSPRASPATTRTSPPTAVTPSSSWPSSEKRAGQAAAAGDGEGVPRAGRRLRRRTAGRPARPRRERRGHRAPRAARGDRLRGDDHSPRHAGALLDPRPDRRSRRHGLRGLRFHARRQGRPAGFRGHQGVAARL